LPVTVTIIDSGPLVAALNRRESAHAWAIEQFRLNAPPFLTCEAVITESCYLLRSVPGASSRVLAMLERGSVRIGFDMEEEKTAVRALFDRYHDLPASLADICLVRMSELYESSVVLTLDSDFHVYRRHGRKTIPLLRPDRT
jgi:predicted nucleic acid-binding protein